MNQKIFSYFNGVEEVWGDPGDILSQLTVECDGNPNAVILATQSEDPVAAERACQKLLAAIRVAFAMPFDRSLATNPEGKGATRDDCFDALDRYQTWLEQKKTSGEDGPSSAPPSGETVSGQ